MGGGEIQNQEKKQRLVFPVGLTMAKLRRLNRQSLINLDLISQTCRTISRTCRLSAALIWFAFLFSGLCSSDAASKTIVGYVNGTIILPCQTNRTDNLLTVEWSKDRGSIITLLFRHGHETIEEKNKAFLNRTSISVDGVKQGDISQTITELRLSDEGQYECRTRLGSQLQIEATLNLIVGAVSEPQLSFVPPGLTLECRAEGWSPEPNITFLDASGNEMKAEPAHVALRPAGYFTVTRRLSLQTDTDRVNCSIYQPLLNQRRNATVYVPGNCMKYCYKEILITGVITGAAFVLVYILWKKQTLLFPFFTRRTQKPSHPTQQANPTAAPRDQAEPAGNTYLSKQIEELKSNIFEKDQLIAKLEADLKELQSKCNTAQQQDRPETDQSSSRQQINQQGNTPPTASLTSLSGKSDQTSKGKGSKPGFSVQHLPTAPLKSGTQKSLPALSISSGAASSGSSLAPATNESNIFRSGSFSGILPTSVRSPRRYTMPNNRFMVLADLAEESESLISEKTKQNHK
ncbi:selection and upkeep of intraepithelial T-cells protein 5-like isoform X2 [Cyprinodon tularosa]|uniref:selection and upkeep of intraepithelial T-cells protein 5-like isoform X2 n=1 Tax=Cyprinodon tularosa TaxID=77115 RepID=UPI0018E1EA3C|nr:selection and upkeep of intraepithelial T-cells protein 5-like isoform X2 [Cyprinodon tularosa]